MTVQSSGRDSVSDIWDEIVAQALESLKANVTPTRGAILRDKVEEIAKMRSADLASYLLSVNLKFGQLVSRNHIAIIHRLPGTDMYVGTQDTQWAGISATPTIATYGSGIRFRADVYAALTRIGERPYFFIRSRDEFTIELSDEPPNDFVRMPAVTLETLLSQRRDFAGSQTNEEVSKELIISIDNSPNPLSAFQTTVSRLRVGGAWHEFNTRALKSNLEMWATENDIKLSSGWYVSPDQTTPRQRPQELLAEFSTHMTDEEIRTLQVPFRAVEAMFREYSKRKTS